MTQPNLVERLKECNAEFLKITMNGHNFLANHGDNNNRDYHIQQINKLNEQYYKLKGRYYIYKKHEQTNIR